MRSVSPAVVIVGSVVVDVAAAVVAVSAAVLPAAFVDAVLLPAFAVAAAASVLVSPDSRVLVVPFAVAVGSPQPVG